tara:strand:+ start:254 stop:940 length:687 start_codon:yes stop_codon:yes gene_type:complete
MDLERIKSPTHEFSSPIRDVDFIFEFPKSLDKDFCDDLIEKFENDDRKYQGVIGGNSHTGGLVNRDIKSTYDLTLSDKNDYKKEDNVLFHALKKGMLAYFEHCKTISESVLNIHAMTSTYDVQDTGYQVQRYEPGEFYVWHHDFNEHSFYGSRQITYIWYLNTIKDGSGYTEFACGKKVKPRVGKLVIFPSSWQYIHRGYPSKSKRKYICTGWVYSKAKIEQPGDKRL